MNTLYVFLILIVCVICATFLLKSLRRPKLTPTYTGPIEPLFPVARAPVTAPAVAELKASVAAVFAKGHTAAISIPSDLHDQPLTQAQGKISAAREDLQKKLRFLELNARVRADEVIKVFSARIAQARSQATPGQNVDVFIMAVSFLEIKEEPESAPVEERLLFAPRHVYNYCLSKNLKPTLRPVFSDGSVTGFAVPAGYHMVLAVSH